MWSEELQDWSTQERWWYLSDVSVNRSHATGLWVITETWKSTNIVRDIPPAAARFEARQREQRSNEVASDPGPAQPLTNEDLARIWPDLEPSAQPGSKRRRL